jgi:hypothetical protein
MGAEEGTMSANAQTHVFRRRIAEYWSETADHLEQLGISVP